MFLFPTLNWNESTSLRCKQDKVHFTTKNYILLCVCVINYEVFYELVIQGLVSKWQSHKFGNCTKVVCMVVIELKLQPGHWQLIPLSILILVNLFASKEN